MPAQNDFQVLLYYRYCTIADPEAFAAAHRELCTKLELRGRILIADEGLNGTVSGTVPATEAYMKVLKQDPLLEGIEFKIDPADDHVFPKLSIKVREEVVTLGLEQAAEPDINPNELTARRLSPAEWKAAIEAGDAIVLDGRNNYESKLGHFRGALCPDVDNFRDFPQWIRENMADVKDRKILTYCTGGIRCEKLSGFLLREGFKDVAQLHGGIINYGKDDTARGQHFEGQCYVFDQRIGVEVNRSEDRTIVSRCVYCQQPSERYLNCRNTACNDQFFLCESCEQTHGRFCKTECSTSETLRPIGQEVLV
ncbi:MAG: rhodanese-related sulfurtransferase [Verrucomicrobiae bacterium]|nr:rhodanese-related sulfurtransferase [Verrucomicrobiae bacterium]